MKKVFAFCLVICMLATLAACGSNNNPTSNDPNNQTAEDNRQSENSEENKQLENTEGTTLNKFEQFEKALTENNIQFDVTEKIASMVGAKEGYGYSLTDGTSIEIYLFDTTTDSYKEAFQNNKLNLEDFGLTFDVVFNGDICIYFNGESISKDVILNIFNNIQ